MAKEMEAEQTKSFSFDRDGYRHQVTWVQATTPVIDEQGLRKALTAKVFDKYTVRKLDRKAMETAMTEGEIDPMVVAQFVTEKVAEAYPRLTMKEVED